MQVSVESVSGLERRMKVQVPAEQIDREVKDRLVKVGKTTKLNGFRKGKVPFSVVKKRFGGQVHREVLGDLIQSTYVEALREQELNPAGQPSIEPSSMEEGADLEYTAVFEVYPEVEVKQLAGLKIERVSSSVGEDDIDGMIETLRTQRAGWGAADRGAKEGDRITIDFVGSIDGEEFEGGKAEDYPVEIGAGQLLPDLENGLVGLKSGDEKSVDVAFPDDYHAEELKGKTASFGVTAKAVEQKELPEVDQEFAKLFGIEDGDMDKFRESVKENMSRELEERMNAQNRQAALDALWDNNTFELPKALVEQEIQAMREDSLRRMGMTDMSQLPPRDAFEDQGVRRVGLGLLLNEVITSENIEVEQELIDAKLASLSSSYEQPDEVIGQYRNNPQLMQQIQMMVLEEQVVNLIMDKADLTEKVLAFNEAMGQ